MYSTQQMKTLCPCKTFLTTYKTTWHYILQNRKKNKKKRRDNGKLKLEPRINRLSKAICFSDFTFFIVLYIHLLRTVEIYF